MSHVVAAGQHATAAAAMEILGAGGNAVDAAIAACAATFVAEPMLSSPGGGGLMTVALADREPVVIDFFANTPGLAGAQPQELDFRGVVVDFGGAVTQEFHIGRGSAAVPGVLPGLIKAHELFGSRELAALLAPAHQLATAGLEVTAETAHTFRLLWPLLEGSAETMALYGGRRPETGDVLANPQLARTLAELGRSGAVPARFHDAICERFGAGAGGLISEADLATYQPEVRPPLSFELAGWQVHTSPLVGGQLVRVIAEALAGTAVAEREADEVLRFARASRAGHEQRRALITPGSTTHISIIDAAGGAVAVTLTNGEGCGELVGDTGVQLNNFLGEEDLNPHGFHLHPAGARLPTMMAPTVATRAGKPALALGSGGSNRIRTAVGQVLYRVACLGQPTEQAVAAPRIHAEDDAVWVELAGLEHPVAALDALAGDFAVVHPFEAVDFFFGGVHATCIDETGHPHAVGDHRRGGTALLG